MNYGQFQTHKHRFTSAFRKVLCESGKSEQLVEAGFCAYADANPLIRFVFWRRLWLTVKFLNLHGPYESILDFGCGSGVALQLMSQLAGRVVGLDINLEPCRLLSSHLPLPENAELFDIKERPLSGIEAAKFDVVVSLDVLEHVEDLHGVFSHLSRLCKPGGVIVFSGPTENLVYKIGRRIAGKEYTGTYHVRNIYDVRKVAELFMEVETLATLYYPLPLFKIYAGRVPVA